MVGELNVQGDKNVKRYLVSESPGDAEFSQVKQLIQKMPIIAQCTDARGHIEYASDLWLETLGFEIREVIGRHYTEFLSPSSKIKAKAIFGKLFLEGFCDNFDCEFVTKDGALLNFCISATALRNRQGEFLRSFAFIKDHTEYQQTTIKNEQLSERLNLALDASRIGIWEWKVLENEFILDDQIYEVYGYDKSVSSHVFDGWEKIIHPDDRARVSEEVRGAADNGSELDTEFRVIDQRGRERHIRAHAIVIRDLQGNAQRMVGANWDISKHKNLLEELKSEQLKMLHAARLASVGEMAAGIAHEVNNPLMVIKTKMEIFNYLLSQEEISKDYLREIACKVDSMVNRIAAIVTGLKNFSRQGYSGRLKEESFGKIMDETLGFFMTKLSDEGIRVDLTKVDRDLHFKTQSLLLSQVIVNLVQNARDAILGSGHPWIELSAQRIDGVVRIKVTDCGGGLSPAQEENIFKPFYTTKSAGKGTGLGLSLSKSIVEGLNGRLYVDRKSNNTSFVMDFQA